MTSSNIIPNKKSAAIYTAYKPDSNFEKRIQVVADQVELIIIVDNTPGGHDFDSSVRNRFVVLQDGINKGLGVAINKGLECAKNHGCDAVILFDQDSTPDDGVVYTLFQVLNECDANCIVGPTLIDDEKNSAIDLIRFENNCTVTPKECIPTSGMAFRLDGLPNDIAFSEELFLDFVDFDWCWRLKEKGWRIYQVSGIYMLHRLGLAQKKILRLTYHVPTPVRHYFQFRDGLRLIGMQHVPIYSKIRYTCILIPKILVYPLILSNGLLRLKWMLLGIKDYILGVKGVGAAARVL